MPGTAVNVGTGTTVTFGTSGYSANLENVDWSGIDREAFPTTHMGTTQAGANQFGGKTFLPSKFADPGEITLEVQFNPQTNPPVHGVAETITVTWPQVTGDSTAASWACSGFVRSFRVSDPHDGKMMATIVAKLTGVATMTDAT
jgi:hypothetical protein